MVGTNTAEFLVYGLARAIIQVSLELCRIKREVVSMKLLELDARVGGFLLEFTDRAHSVTSSEGLLMPEENIARGMIHRNGTTDEARGHLLLTIGVGEASSHGRFILI
jgi:hypothetical protein